MRKKASIILFGVGFGSCFLIGLLLWYGSRLILHRSPLSYVYGMTTYPDSYPVQYIFVVCLVYSLLNISWSLYLYPRFPRGRFFQVLIVIVTSTFLSGMFCGGLWVIHDMLAGFIPSFPTNVNYLFWGIGQGLALSPIIAVASFPVNIIAFIFAYLFSYYFYAPSYAK